MFRPPYPDTHVQIRTGTLDLRGSLMVPPNARGLVILTHPCTSSYLDPRMRFIAGGFVCQGFATLLLDLLVLQEQEIDSQNRHFHANIDLLASRLADVTDWAQWQTGVVGLEIGYFATDIAVAAAIHAAVDRAGEVTAIVSLAGKPELAGSDLEGLKAATLLIVSQDDPAAVSLHEGVLKRLANAADRQLAMVPGMGGAPIKDAAWQRIAQLAGAWFQGHLGGPAEAEVGSQSVPTRASYSPQ